MPASTAVVVDVGGLPLQLETSDPHLIELLEERFGRFVNPCAVPRGRFDITVVAPESLEPGADLAVWREGERCVARRGDFHAEWDPWECTGLVRQSRNPYAIDSLLRIVHTMALSMEGGFLLHASSAVVDGRALLFTGPSGAGKSTIAKLAPEHATVLTDEISYVRRIDDDYVAYGTPFSGELADVGTPLSAPVAALYELARGQVNTVEPLPLNRAVRVLMRNILFFAHDRTLVSRVFETACDFASRIPSHRLAFVPDQRVWQELA